MAQFEYEQIDAALKAALKPGMGAEEAAKAAHAALVPICRDTHGQKPDIEMFIAKPGERSEVGNAWWVCWEAGPYDWGVCSGAGHYLGGKVVETYWGFDLIFYVNELGA